MKTLVACFALITVMGLKSTVVNPFRWIGILLVDSKEDYFNCQ